MNQFNSGRWGYDDDDAPAENPPPIAPSDDLGDHITGQDPDGIVTVAVDEEAAVIAVRLKSGWQSGVSRLALHTNVVAAMNAATMQAVAQRAGQAMATIGAPVGTGAPPVPSEAHGNERPITKEDASRLISAVHTDLEQYVRRATAITNQVLTVSSSGHHVQVTGRQRQVTGVTIDAKWASGAPNTEIESELRDALSSFTTQSSLGDLAGGPRSSAIDELMSLVGNPRELVRRINLPR